MKRPKSEEDHPVIARFELRRHSLPRSLSFDNRAVTRGRAARFLKALRENFERPA